jgi:vancomycin resistance protein YoaR
MKMNIEQTRGKLQKAKGQNFLSFGFALRLSPFALFLCLLFSPQTEAAAPPSITYRNDHFLFPVITKNYPEWQIKKEVWQYKGMDIAPPAELLVDGDALPELPAGITKTSSVTWNRGAIRDDLESLLQPLERDPGNVVISRTGSGKVTFEGVGLPGRHVDLDLTVTLTIEALEQGIPEIRLPIIETQPHITVTDPKLAAAGIQEVVTVGESNFDRSPANRRHNIATGLAKFNGHLIPKGSIFSFDQVLGRVDNTTGYLKELVIKGNRTEPDYGGGLCQVSSTAYRGVWEYGFPITQRKNHSYAVNHYSPQGTDATVYPPSVDMKFTNDSPGDLLIQTYSEHDLAYFIYYGTKDGRDSEVIGPYTWDHTSPPADRYEKTAEIPAGTTKKLGERVPGMKTLWVRVTEHDDGTKKMEPVYSTYEARPLYYLVGVAPSELPATATDGTASSSSAGAASSSVDAGGRRNEANVPKPPR